MQAETQGRRVNKSVIARASERSPHSSELTTCRRLTELSIGSPSRRIASRCFRDRVKPDVSIKLVDDVGSFETGLDVSPLSFPCQGRRAARKLLQRGAGRVGVGRGAATGCERVWPVVGVDAGISEDIAC